MIKKLTIPATKKKIPKKKDKNIFPIPNKKFINIESLAVNIVFSLKDKFL
jgi:hypothetical protein